MLSAVAQSVPIAIGLVVAALPIVLISLVLTTKRPAMVSRAFVGGWLLGLSVVGSAVLLLADTVSLATGSRVWASYLKLVLGVLLIVLAARKWSKRPRPGEPPEVPSWMAGAETMTAGRAFSLALLLGAVNPKNVVLVIAGATVIADATEGPGAQFGALAVFVLVASLGVGAPALLQALLGERSAPVLAAADSWLSRNNAPLMSGVLLVLGVLLIVNGATGL